jgi:hypothetical protein
MLKRVGLHDHSAITCDFPICSSRETHCHIEMAVASKGFEAG